MVPHPDKCKAMISQWQPFIGYIQALHLGNNTINWTTSERLLGVHVDNKMTWSDQHFASKLSLLRRMQFFPRKQLEDFYTKVTLPSVTCSLVVWGSCNETHFSNLEKLHARAGRIVYGLSWDTSTADALTQTRWDSFERMYKVRLAEFTFKCIKGHNATELKDLFVRRETQTAKAEGTEKLPSQGQRQIL